jgi:signal transduction histidine kinase
VEIITDGRLQAGSIDRRLIRIALKQILDNALKYSYPRTPISIRISHAESTVAVEITNQGQAISAEEQGRIFERFYRSPELQQKIPGSGLGLTIAQSIVRAHQGNLAVISRPGENTFRMSLPAEPEGGAS